MYIRCRNAGLWWGFVFLPRVVAQQVDQCRDCKMAVLDHKMVWLKFNWLIDWFMFCVCESTHSTSSFDEAYFTLMRLPQSVWQSQASQVLKVLWITSQLEVYGRPTAILGNIPYLGLIAWQRDAYQRDQLTHYPTVSLQEKCAQYWPTDNEARYYGDLQVTMRSESTLDSYTIRMFDVCLVSMIPDSPHEWLHGKVNGDIVR